MKKFLDHYNVLFIVNVVIDKKIYAIHCVVTTVAWKPAKNQTSSYMLTSWSSMNKIKASIVCEILVSKQLHSETKNLLQISLKGQLCTRLGPKS